MERQVRAQYAAKYKAQAVSFGGDSRGNQGGSPARHLDPDAVRLDPYRA